MRCCKLAEYMGVRRLIQLQHLQPCWNTYISCFSHAKATTQAIYRLSCRVLVPHYRINLSDRWSGKKARPLSYFWQSFIRWSPSIIYLTDASAKSKPALACWKSLDQKYCLDLRRIIRFSRLRESMSITLPRTGFGPKSPTGRCLWPVRLHR
jgi:hypothetical protein